MKTVKRASKLLKGFSNSTRLRIVNLLYRQKLNVKELCTIMDKKQSLISKHLAQLRLLEIVVDKKEGLNVYYYLPKTSDKVYQRLLKGMTEGFDGLQLIKKDAANLKRLKRGMRNSVRSD
jgi:ArsR family transcriptional regulator, arsenate/arsenite/antimonite-responsive transcriptional repressor